MPSLPFNESQIAVDEFFAQIGTKKSTDLGSLHKPVSIIEENGKKPLSLAETTSLMLWLCPLLVSQLTDKVLIHPINSYGITNPRKEKPRYR